MKVLIPVYCAGLWICCMFCHGELARRKPNPVHLTSFYLMVSLGGAIGAVFVALIAPAIFSGYYELPCALGMCAVLVLMVQFRDPSRIFQGGMWGPARLVLAGLLVALLASLTASVREVKREARLSVRNFYGVLRVIDHEGTSSNGTTFTSGNASGRATGRATGHMAMYLSPYQTSYRRLMNGTIDHGLQFLSEGLRRRPTSYYSEKSGIGIALKAIQGRGALRVGVVGLGAGTLAAYGKRGDRYTFYEINPLDVRIAEEEFTFLRDSGAKIDIVAGDARLSLERESSQGYDALVVDAFSSDSIPVHLLTREAFELYFRQLKPDGVLALHISNQYLNLQPVVEGAAAQIGKEAILVNNGDDHQRGVYSAAWILMGRPEGFYGNREMEGAGVILLLTGREHPWTDNYSSVFRIIK
jgi:SAM-dependent methyltransferase